MATLALRCRAFYFATFWSTLMAGSSAAMMVELKMSTAMIGPRMVTTIWQVACLGLLSGRREQQMPATIRTAAAAKANSITIAD